MWLCYRQSGPPQPVFIEKFTPTSFCKPAHHSPKWDCTEDMMIKTWLHLPASNCFLSVLHTSLSLSLLHATWIPLLGPLCTCALRKLREGPPCIGTMGGNCTKRGKIGISAAGLHMRSSPYVPAQKKTHALITCSLICYLKWELWSFNTLLIYNRLLI